MFLSLATAWPCRIQERLSSDSGDETVTKICLECLVYIHLSYNGHVLVWQVLQTQALRWNQSRLLLKSTMSLASIQRMPSQQLSSLLACAVCFCCFAPLDFCLQQELIKQIVESYLFLAKANKAEAVVLLCPFDINPGCFASACLRSFEWLGRMRDTTAACLTWLMPLVLLCLRPM